LGNLGLFASSIKHVPEKQKKKHIVLRYVRRLEISVPIKRTKICLVSSLFIEIFLSNRASMRRILPACLEYLLVTNCDLKLAKDFGIRRSKSSVNGSIRRKARKRYLSTRKPFPHPKERENMIEKVTNKRIVADSLKSGSLVPF